jgi:hypothetical protein
MTPLHLLGIAAAAGAGWWLYENKFKKAALPGQAPGQMPGMVSELTQGRSYTVMAVLNKTINTNDPVTASAVLRSSFEQWGAKVLSQPTVRDADEMKKFLGGEPSTWVFSMQWTRSEKYIPANPQWLSGASFILLPIQ